MRAARAKSAWPINARLPKNLKQALSRFLTVRDSGRGMVLVLAESLWATPRSAKLVATAAAKLDQIGALLANSPDYQNLDRMLYRQCGQRKCSATTDPGSRQSVV